jgi:Xaa-Pro aminopeptidase
LRSDIDRLLAERGLAGLVVLAYDRYDAAFHYATGQKIHHGLYLRSATGAARVLHDPMERDQAAAVGCEALSYAQLGFLQRLKSADSAAHAYAELLAAQLQEMGVQGRVAFAGDAGIAFGHALLAHLVTLAPGIVPEASQPGVLALARATKSAEELDAIRHCSRGAVDAMTRVRDWLAGLRRDGDDFRTERGEVATLGHIRRLLHLTFAEHGLSEDGESIVAMGRDAGVPHNRGDDRQAVRAGQPILVDIFPGEAGGGYHTDMTRTFCLGPAPAPLATLYAQCREAFDAAMAWIALDRPCRDGQETVCDVFERQGHPTPRSRPGLTEGYVHGLGHGVGLAVHEGPSLAGPPTNTTRLAPGHVVSVEPGLYYPSRGLGVRIEDLVVAHADGRIENLTPAPYDLVVPIRP